jgi:hypothetical protein
MPGHPPVWILRLVPDVRHGSLAYASATFLALMLAYAAAGIFGERPSTAAPANVAVFFAAILAYIVPVFRYIVTRSREAFEELVPHLAATTDELEGWRGAIGRASAATQLQVAALGLAAGLLHNLALASPVGLLAVVRTSAADAAIVAGTWVVWLIMTTAIFGLIDVARAFARLGARVRVDLLQPRALTPFARVAVFSTLAIIGAQAAFPILWLNAELSVTASLPGLVATVIPMMFLFFLPIVSVHRTIAAAKRAELERLDGMVAKISQQEGDEGRRVAQLVPVLAYRQEVERAREWPFDTSVTSRLGFYLVIPPLTWVASAVVERLLEGAL